MPGRKVPLVTDEVYHVINRGIASQPVFIRSKDYHRTMEVIFYYQKQNPPLSYSHYLRLNPEQKNEVIKRWGESRPKLLVKLISLCLLPNHLHLLLKQNQENGISTFMSNLTNSYTRFFNTKNDRVGPLFQGKFKAVLVETNEQLLHVTRYIHLNPYTAHIVKNLKDLEGYSYSSLPEYLGNSNTNLFQKDIVLGQFQNPASYKEFVFNQAEYQRQLARVKHLLLE